MWPFKKKKKKSVEKESGDSDKSKESSPSEKSDSALANKVEMMNAQFTKIDGVLESLKEARNMSNERFSTVNEQVGELRGMITDIQRALGKVEVQATKAADLVESVHPDRLMIQVQKSDGKIEGLRGILEAKEEMIKNIMEQLRKIRNQVTVFRGIEQVVKLNEEVKDELMDVKKISGAVERHADRIDNVFLESQKSFEAFNTFADKLQDLKAELKTLTAKNDKLEVATLACVKKKDFDARLVKIEKFDKEAKKLMLGVKKYYKKLDDKFSDLELRLGASFDRKLKKAEIVSEAFLNALKDNPMLCEGIQLDDYIVKEIEKDRQSKELKKKEKSASEEESSEDSEEETSESEEDSEDTKKDSKNKKSKDKKSKE